MTHHLIHTYGVLVKGVQNIRMTVFDHVASHCRASNVIRPGVEGLNFRKLTFTQSGSLVRPFFVEEVRQVVWDCKRFKSLGPDGMQFGFIKDF